jgi:hypothetical protein
MGLNPGVPDAPAELIFYHQQKELGIPLVAGGIVDQPHIWLEQYATCMQKETFWTEMIKNAARSG